MGCVVICLELLDKGEDVAVILAQELSETLDVLCMNLPLRNHAPAICEVLIDLVVQLFAVCYYNEPPARPVSFSVPSGRRRSLRYSFLSLAYARRHRASPDSIPSFPRLQPRCSRQGTDGSWLSASSTRLWASMNSVKFSMMSNSRRWSQMPLNIVCPAKPPPAHLHLSTRFHLVKCSQRAVRLPTRLSEPLERIIRALYQNRWGIVSL